MRKERGGEGWQCLEAVDHHRLEQQLRLKACVAKLGGLPRVLIEQREGRVNERRIVVSHDVGEHRFQGRRGEGERLLGDGGEVHVGREGEGCELLLGGVELEDRIQFAEESDTYMAHVRWLLRLELRITECFGRGEAGEAVARGVGVGVVVVIAGVVFFAVRDVHIILILLPGGVELELGSG